MADDAMVDEDFQEVEPEPEPERETSSAPREKRTPRAKPAKPASHYVSSTIPQPTPLKSKMVLSDFKYHDSYFPDEAPHITAASSSKDVTVKIISDILAGELFDQALQFMLNNQTVVRFFEPRSVMKGKRYAPADYDITEPHHARAMAYYLLDVGTRKPLCKYCQSEQGLGPFKACIIPDDPDATGACTNCIYMKRASKCSHRAGTRPISPLKKAALAFEGFTGKDMVNATDSNLVAWKDRIETELRTRGTEGKADMVRGPTKKPSLGA